MNTMRTFVLGAVLSFVCSAVNGGQAAAGEPALPQGDAAPIIRNAPPVSPVLQTIAAASATTGEVEALTSAATETAGQAPSPTSDASLTQASTLDEDYPPTDISDRWEFETYRYGITLPKERLGWWYPIAGMAHGVVFPLGPLGKEEEHRDLLVWAYFDLREDGNSNPVSLRDQLLENLIFTEEADPVAGAAQFFQPRKPGTYLGARFFERRQGGITFLGYMAAKGPLRSLTALGHAGPKGCLSDEGCGVIYDFTLNSTPEFWEEDLAYFNQVFATFELFPLDPAE